MKQEKKKRRDLLWYLPRDAWRLAASVGTIAMVMIAVIMHVYGWITDDSETMWKGLEGIGYALGYFLIVCFLKVVYEGINNMGKQKESLKDILTDVEIKRR